MPDLNVNLIQLDRIDDVLANWQKQNNVQLQDDIIATIKNEINEAVEFIKTHTDGGRMDFYFSEYPMGAVHSKGIIFSNGEWLLTKTDYDKKPPYKSIKLSNCGFIEAFIEI